METDPVNRNLLELVRGAQRGEIVLPQFQRNFVWSRDDITELMASVLEGHFIGSFLLLHTDAQNVPFAMRAIQGVNLQHAPPIPLRGTKYPYRFFLDLREVTEGSLDEAITSDRSDRVQEILEQPYQFENLIVPFSVLTNWNGWLNEYEKWLIERDKEAYFSQYFQRDKPAWNSLIQRIRNFQVPTILIPHIPANDPDRLAEVCAIFEKMNSTGVRLSVYDLLTARLYKDGIDLHKLWEAAVDEHPLLRRFSHGQPDQYGVYMLRIVALIRGVDVKSKALINLSPKGFAEDWRRATRAAEKALQRLASTGEDGFGVFDEEWSTYSTMISPMAAFLDYIDTKCLDYRAYRLLRRWYWSSVLTERYAGSVESTIQRDYLDLLRAVKEPGFEPDALAFARVNVVENEQYSLRNVARRNATYRGIMCLIAKKGAKDFQADDSIEFHALDDHHIFPRAYLEKQRKPDGSKYSSDLINTIVNRTLISSNTNRRISRSSPAEYIERLVPCDREEEIMASHFIDHQALEAMRRNDYEGFLDAREKTLKEVLRSHILGDGL